MAGGVSVWIFPWFFSKIFRQWCLRWRRLCLGGSFKLFGLKFDSFSSETEEVQVKKIMVVVSVKLIIIDEWMEVWCWGMSGEWMKENMSVILRPSVKLLSFTYFGWRFSWSVPLIFKFEDDFLTSLTVDCFPPLLIWLTFICNTFGCSSSDKFWFHYVCDIYTTFFVVT